MYEFIQGFHKITTFKGLPAMRPANISGFTLIEILIVIAIVAVLAAIAVPSYQSHMRETRRTEGQAKLMEVMNAQERYYTVNNTYTTDLTKLNYTDPEPTENNYYNISAAACGTQNIANCILLTATPEPVQANDGPLTYNSLGQRTPADKWQK